MEHSANLCYNSLQMKRIIVILLLVLFPALLLAKNEPPIVLLWPNQNSPSLKLTFGRFNQVGGYSGQLSLESDVLIQNMTGKRIAQASFTVYMMDKNGVRIGNGTLSVNDLEGGQQAKIAFQVMSVGIPSTLKLVARNDAAGIPTSTRTVALKVISVPPGATLKADGQDVGITPVTVALSVGNHNLTFSKEGYATGSTPVEIKADDAPGGSITLELGGLARDNVELRDGTVLRGDVRSTRSYSSNARRRHRQPLLNPLPRSHTDERRSGAPKDSCRYRRDEGLVCSAGRRSHKLAAGLYTSLFLALLPSTARTESSPSFRARERWERRTPWPSSSRL